MTQTDDEFELELRRTVDRLRTMPLTRLPNAEEPTRAVMCTLADDDVPRIAVHALGDQLQVVADEAARTRGFDRVTGAALLAELRRALP